MYKYHEINKETEDFEKIKNNLISEQWIIDEETDCILILKKEFIKNQKFNKLDLFPIFVLSFLLFFIFIFICFPQTIIVLQDEFIKNK